MSGCFLTHLQNDLQCVHGTSKPAHSLIYSVISSLVTGWNTLVSNWDSLAAVSTLHRTTILNSTQTTHAFNNVWAVLTVIHLISCQLCQSHLVPLTHSARCITVHIWYQSFTTHTHARTHARTHTRTRGSKVWLPVPCGLWPGSDYSQINACSFSHNVLILKIRSKSVHNIWVIPHRRTTNQQ